MKRGKCCGRGTWTRRAARVRSVNLRVAHGPPVAEELNGRILDVLVCMGRDACVDFDSVLNTSGARWLIKRFFYDCLKEI